MSALNKITEEILKQAGAQADEILNEANQKAAEIMEKGKADRMEGKRQFEETAERECREIINRAESADRQNRRRALLEVRNQVIDEIIAEAKTKIEDQPDDKYFDFLFRLFKKYAQPLDGVIRFASADYVKIPDSFLDRCKQVFPDHTLLLSGDMEGIGHGFVIQYGNILQNCSVDGIFESEGQMLRDKVYEVLTADA